MLPTFYIGSPHKIPCYIHGDSEEVLVFLHGFCEDASIWDTLLPELTAYKVITLDFAGFGLSETPDIMTMDALALQVKKVLLFLGIDKCVLIGHSMGGYIALAFADAYPELLTGFGLFHSHPYSDSDEKKLNRLKSIDFVERNGVAPFVKQLFYSLFAPDFARQHTELVEEKIAYASRFSKEAISYASQAMRSRIDSSEVLLQTELPVLFICGKQDQTISWQLSLAQIQLPRIAQVCLLENVGHLGMIEEPKATATAIRDFLALCGEQFDKKNV